MVLNILNTDKIYYSGDNIDGFTIHKVLGEGKFGICYLVEKNNCHFILKQLKQNMLKKIGNKVNYEETILKKLSHNSIPKFIQKINFENFSGYILEYIEGETFEKIICKNNYVFNREEIYNICSQLINILKYLHNNKIVHRDIRIPNTIYHNKKVYLVDFGLSRLIDNDRYTNDVDFSYLGDFLLYLYYTSYKKKTFFKRPWYKELDLYNTEKIFLKKLLSIEQSYNNIYELEKDFLLLKTSYTINKVTKQ